MKQRESVNELSRKNKSFEKEIHRLNGINGNLNLRMQSLQISIDDLESKIKQYEKHLTILMIVVIVLLISICSMLVYFV